jgi:general L-amino acid transport system permease protein
MTIATAPPRITPPIRWRWSDRRTRSILYQALLLAAVLLVGLYFWSNASGNIARRGLELGFAFLGRTANFAIGESVIPYSPANSYGRAILAGAANTLIVAVIGCILTTVLGVALGIMRLSTNPLLSRLVGVYVELGRNVPLLLQLFFWYSLVTRLGGSRQAWSPLPGVFVSNRGLRAPAIIANETFVFALSGFAVAILASLLLRHWAGRRQSATGQRPPLMALVLALMIGLPSLAIYASGGSLQIDYPKLQGFNFVGGMELSPEFVALLTGLTLYTSAFVTEIVRSGIQAVPHGQWEASRALGLPNRRIMRLVILPQALRVMFPTLTSQYLNLIKNSSLAVAIGYPDLINISNTVINQTGQALEVIFIFMAIYLVISLTTSAAMNALNTRLTAR